MSRNGPTGQPVRPPVRRHPEHDPYTAPPTGQPSNPWPAQPPAGYPGSAHQHQHPQQGQGYYFPPAGEPDPNYGYAPHAAPQAPAFDRYAAQPPAPAYAPQQPHAAPPQWGQPQDAGSYDLGSYMPSGNQGYPPGNQGYAPVEPPFQQTQDHGQYGAPHQGYGDSDADYDESLAEGEEEPRRGRRGLLIAAALVGAIGLGGAMAYTYKTLFGAAPGRPPLVKANEAGPSKVKPIFPGGKEFAHTDKKLLNRLDDNSAPGADPSAQDERAGDDPNAPRKVRIIPIQPGGAGAAPVTTSSAPPRPPMVTVPGLTIDTGPPAAPRVQAPPQAPSPPPVVSRQAPQGQPPMQQPQQRVATAPAPPPVIPVEPPQRKSTVPAAAQPAAAPPKNPVPRTKETAAVPATSSSGASGYVAVLSSQKSRMDALKAFADLQQKYGDVLASRTPDVQEANLGDKGIWYRAVVGPPGSRDAASGVCTQLKTAGYVGCWVTAY